MKILMASILNFDNDINGVVVHAQAHTKALRSEGHDVEIINPYITKSILLGKLINRSSRIQRNTGSSFFFLFNILFKMISLSTLTLKLRNQYNYFHAHDVISALAGLLSFGKKKPVIFQVHCNESPWDEFVSGGFVKRDGIAYFILRWVFSKTINNDRLRLIHVSSSNKKFMSTIFPGTEKRSIVLYPGFRRFTNSGTKIDTNKYMINVGTINTRKNQVLIIDILAELEKFGIIMPVVLVGPEEGLHRRMIEEKIIRSGIKSPVHFTGKLPEDQVSSLVAGAEFYIHTSRQESLGLSVLEAAGAGIPVFAVEYDALHEIVDECSILKADWDPSRMAAYIYYYLTNPRAMDIMKEKQGALIREKFSEEITVNTYLNTLKDKWSHS